MAQLIYMLMTFLRLINITTGIIIFNIIFVYQLYGNFAVENFFLVRICFGRQNNLHVKSSTTTFSIDFSPFYGGTNSFWVSGGYHVSGAFSGYLAKLSVYRYNVLRFNQNTDNRFKKEEKEELLSYVSESWYTKCSAIQNMVKFIAGVGVKGRETCTLRSMLYKSKSHDDPRICPKRKPRRKFSRELEALRKDLKMLKSRMREQDAMMTVDFAHSLHEMVVKNLVGIEINHYF
jgi:hypothetical protein